MSLDSVVKKDERSFWSKVSLAAFSALTALGLYDSVPNARSDEAPRDTPVQFASPTQSVDDVLFEEPKLPNGLAPPVIQANPAKCTINYTVVIDFEDDPLLVNRCFELFFNIAKYTKVIDFPNSDTFSLNKNLMTFAKDKHALLDFAVNMDSMDGFADDCIRVSGLKKYVDAQGDAALMRGIKKDWMIRQFSGGTGFFHFDLDKHPYADAGNVTDIKIHSSGSTLMHTEKFTFSSNEDYEKFLSAIEKPISNGVAFLLALDVGGEDREFSTQELAEFEKIVKRTSTARRFLHYPARHIYSAFENDEIFAEKDPVRRNFNKEFAYMDVEGVFVFVDAAGKESAAVYDKFLKFAVAARNKYNRSATAEEYTRLMAWSLDGHDKATDGVILDSTIDAYSKSWEVDGSKIELGDGKGRTRLTYTTSVLFHSPKLRDDFATKVKAFSLSNSTVEWVFYGSPAKLLHPVTVSSKNPFAEELKRLEDLSKTPGYKVTKSYGSILP